MNKLLVTLASLVIVNGAYAADTQFSEFGNITNEAFLQQYLNSDNIGDANLIVDRWIDGWMDGMFSIYAFDGVLDQQGLIDLYTCVGERFPTATSVRKQLLQWGADADLKDMMTSKSMYYAVRFSCKHILGEVITDNGKEETRS